MTAVALFSDSLVQHLRQYPQVECPLVHNFCGGVYARQITMPAGTFVVGKRHKTEHFNIILKGKANVLIDGVVSEIVAPCILNSGIDVRKVLYIIEEMVWVTIHPTQETDVQKLEEMLVYPLEAADCEIGHNDLDLLVGEVHQ